MHLYTRNVLYLHYIKLIKEPPYLDIGESKDQIKSKMPLKGHTFSRPCSMTILNLETGDTTIKDAFDEEDNKEPTERDLGKLRMPAELQSPKMIIEEQMDKVVTKVDPYQKEGHNTDELADDVANRLSLDGQSEESANAQHDVYTMEDGSALLERVLPEAITSTTIAKETFIVRPLGGDIHSTWMEVTHTSFHGINQLIDKSSRKPSEGDQVLNGRGEHGSIVLDISGYKTEDERKNKDAQTAVDESRNIDKEGPQENLGTAGKNESTALLGGKTDAAATQTSSASQKTLATDDKQKVISGGIDETSSNDFLDAKSSDRKSAPDTKVHLESGATYRIEMSLCGLSSLGRDKAENAKIFEEQQITYHKFVHNPNLLNDRRLVFRYEGRYYAAGRKGPLFTSLLLFDKSTDIKDKPPAEDTIIESESKVSDSRESYLFGKGWRQWWSRSSVAEPTVEEERDEERDDSTHRHRETSTTTTFTTTTTTTSVGWSVEHEAFESQENKPFTLSQKNYAKTLRLTSEQLKSLGLKKGSNKITFSVTSAYQGTATCTANIFYWDYDIQIVISDIDGTITKSDALGHVFTMLGKDWTHRGVAKLYTDIRNNGYHIMYLTSRAIGQADYTRDYLRKIDQAGYQLPEGPVIMSPDRLFTSFHREVIMRKPEVFKMACLRDILRLFDGHNPFYAGFGNRITDAISYRSVDVPASRIFTIDPNGNVKLELLLGFMSSYIHLNDLVDQIFPPVNQAVKEEFNDWNYWKPPLPQIEIPELEEDRRPPPTSPKPVPIKPDPSSSLPSSAIVESEAQKNQQRGLLRSFTTRSSTTDARRSSSSSGAGPFSRSSPALIARASGRASPDSSGVGGASSEVVTTDERTGVSVAAQPWGRPESPPLFGTTPPSPLGRLSSPSPVPSSTSSTSSLVNKVITGGLGGVRSTLSRTFAARKSSLSEASAPLSQDTAKTQKEEEQEPQFEFDDEEIDMDSIPFI